MLAIHLTVPFPAAARNCLWLLDAPFARNLRRLWDWSVFPYDNALYGGDHAAVKEYGKLISQCKGLTGVRVIVVYIL